MRYLFATAGLFLLTFFVVLTIVPKPAARCFGRSSACGCGVACECGPVCDCAAGSESKAFAE